MSYQKHPAQKKPAQSVALPTYFHVSIELFTTKSVSDNASIDYFLSIPVQVDRNKTKHIWCFQEFGQSPSSLGLDKRNNINVTKYWAEFSVPRTGQGSVTVLMSLL